MISIEAFKSGTYVRAVDYKAFNPNTINKPYSWNDRELTRLVEEATLRLGQLDAYADLVPNIDHFIRMYVAKEAIVSSRIEGTQTNIEEALLKEKDIEPERKNDWREVNNYIKAMNTSIIAIPRLPLSTRMLKTAHASLLNKVRGDNKMPGEFRKSQNWVGGSSLNSAVFIPPIWQDVDSLMGDLEKFLHNEDTGLTHLMKIALAHYQFETIHPFLDGNGRIGRLMITLYLVEKSVLKKPVLYLSDYFERNKSYYYDNLMRVRTHHDLTRWMKFFLRGVSETSQNSIQALKEILQLKKDCEEKRIYKLGKKVASAKILLDHLFDQPILGAEEISKVTHLSLVSSYKLIEDFIRVGILEEMTGMKRNRVFVFTEYFSIFKK